jgi:uncharacterized protein (DUF305 family)
VKTSRRHLRRPARLALHVAAVATAFSLAGCGSDDPDSQPAQDAAASEESSDHNEADVAFASQMIPHHAQALMMTDMTLGRELDKDVAALVDDIRAAQAPEIELMADWLQEWGEPVPETVRDHAHGGHEGESGDMGDMAGSDGMEGMMSEEQLAELEDAPPADFEEMWLEMMVEHHEGAVAMAETEIEEGSFQPALDLAEAIASSQTEEIEQMQGMLEN